MFLKRTLLILMMGMIGLSFPSCTGILGGIYDEPSEYGFIESWGNEGTLYLDVNEYSQWTYINFETRQIDTRDIEIEGKENPSLHYGIPENWDIAFHKYDCKTNSGAVLKTEFDKIDDLMKSGRLPAGNYVRDIPACKPEEVDNPEAEGRIRVDMSRMMEGIIIYAPSPRNMEIAGWLESDTSTMPPVYTIPGKVYLVQLENDRYLALDLINYGSGKLTVKYHYPVEF